MSLCPHCGKEGAHYVASPHGEKGNYACETFNKPADKVDTKALQYNSADAAATMVVSALVGLEESRLVMEKALSDWEHAKQIWRLRRDYAADIQKLLRVEKKGEA